VNKQKLKEKNHAMHLLLQKVSGDIADFRYTAQQLKELVDGEIYIIDKKGKIIAAEKSDAQIFTESIGEYISDKKQGFIYQYTQGEYNILFEGYSLMIIPVLNMGERLGTIIYAREKDFTDDEFMLGEYGGVITAVQIMRDINKKAETEIRKKNIVQLALEVLSYSELEAVKYIFGEIEGNEGFLVASKLAEEYKLTRSVIVNALRKLESAGVIDARSLGMKGTYIKILNDYLYEELAKV